VRRTARVLARTYDSALTGSGLNITQFAVLRAVQRHPGEPLARVAEDLAMDRTSLYRALGALERQRWVVLHGGPDGRTRTAAVSAAGAAALSRAEQGWSATQRALVERFGHARWQSLVAELQRLSDCARELATLG
jgi:DNA-binding MarR family transcriptional regulator